MSEEGNDLLAKRVKLGDWIDGSKRTLHALIDFDKSIIFVSVPSGQCDT